MKKIGKGSVSPVFKKFERIKIQTHFNDECWSIDLIDKSLLAKYKKVQKRFLLYLIIIPNVHGQFLYYIEVVQKTHRFSRFAFKKKKENRIHFGLIGVKKFL